jgi:hypothetical protein
MAQAVVALNQLATAQERPPEWAGWLGLAALIAVLGLVTWWLFASPLRGDVQQVALTTDVLRTRSAWRSRYC